MNALMTDLHKVISQTASNDLVSVVTEEVRDCLCLNIHPNGPGLTLYVGTCVCVYACMCGVPLKCI